jgi:hypothetical protein
VRVGLSMFVLCVAAGCSKSSSDAPPAPEVPWQPHGWRVPTVHCVFTIPPGWIRGGPMPDHIAELARAPVIGPDGATVDTLIVEERVERDLATAQTRVMAFWRSGLLTAEGARVSGNASLDDAGASGQVMSVRWGLATAGQVETVALLAFPGLPVVDVVARYAESDTATATQVQDFVRSLGCSN